MLTLANFFEGSDGEIHCKNCYIAKFFVDGKNFFLDYSNVVGTNSDFSDPEACPKCHAPVFEAERVLTKGGQYHRKCLGCSDCKRLLDCSTYYDGKDRQIYCKNCYAIKFGHLSRTDQTSEIENTFFAASDGDIKCTGCSGKVFEAEKLLTSFGIFHRTCYKCNDCSRVFNATPAYKYR